MHPADVHPVVVSAYPGYVMVPDTYPTRDHVPLSLVELAQDQRRGYRLIQAFAMANPDERYPE